MSTTPGDLSKAKKTDESRPQSASPLLFSALSSSVVVAPSGVVVEIDGTTHIVPSNSQQATSHQPTTTSAGSGGTIAVGTTASSAKAGSVSSAPDPQRDRKANEDNSIVGFHIKQVNELDALFKKHHEKLGKKQTQKIIALLERTHTVEFALFEEYGEPSILEKIKAQANDPAATADKIDHPGVDALEYYLTIREELAFLRYLDRLLEAGSPPEKPGLRKTQTIPWGTCLVKKDSNTSLNTIEDFFSNYSSHAQRQKLQEKLSESIKHYTDILHMFQNIYIWQALMKLVNDPSSDVDKTIQNVFTQSIEKTIKDISEKIKSQSLEASEIVDKGSQDKMSLFIACYEKFRREALEREERAKRAKKTSTVCVIS